MQTNFNITMATAKENYKRIKLRKKKGVNLNIFVQQKGLV